MGIATSYHQVLRAQCFPPRSIHPTVSAADHLRCSAPIRGKLCRIRPSPDAKPGRTPPFSLLDFLRFRMRCSDVFVFDFFNFSACRPPSLIPHLRLIFFDLIHLSPPAMHYLILRSHYSQVVVTSIAVAESQDVSHASLPVPYGSNQWPKYMSVGSCYWSCDLLCDGFLLGNGMRDAVAHRR